MTRTIIITGASDGIGAEAARVLAAGPEEIADRSQAGTLADLPGIGAATAAVIQQAMDGQVPEYLQALEDKNVGPVATGGERDHRLGHAAVAEAALQQGA